MYLLCGLFSLATFVSGNKVLRFVQHRSRREVDKVDGRHTKFRTLTPETLDQRQVCLGSKNILLKVRLRKNCGFG